MALVALGLSLVTAVGALVVSRIDRDQKWNEAVQRASVATAESHLRLEELLGGRDDRELERDVLRPLREATELSSDLADDGGRLPALGGDGLVAVRQLAPSLEAFRETTLRRSASESPGGTTGDAHEAAYARAIDDLARMGDALRKEIADGQRQLAWFCGGIAMCLLGIVVAIVALVRRHNRWITDLAARTSAIVDSAGEGILGVGADGTLIFLNRSAIQMLRQPRHHLVGAPEHASLHPNRESGEDYPADECPIDRARRGLGGLARVEDDVFRTGDDRPLPVAYTTAPLIEEGRPAGAVVVFQDVTQRRELEQLKDRMAATVGHELRTPITAIKGALELLQDGVSPREGKLVDMAVRNTDRLLLLVRDLLDLERLRDGRLPMQMMDTDVAAIAAASCEIVEHQAADRGISLELDLDPAPVHADPDRLGQVATNLLTNALKFTSRGGRVSVSTSCGDGRVKLTVADLGRGIPADRLERIFERFEQVEEGDRKLGGAGLGLAISRHIVDAHGGEIYAESEFGVGSTFAVELPS